MWRLTRCTLCTETRRRVGLMFVNSVVAPVWLLEKGVEIKTNIPVVCTHSQTWLCNAHFHPPLYPPNPPGHYRGRDGRAAPLTSVHLSLTGHGAAQSVVLLRVTGRPRVAVVPRTNVQITLLLHPGLGAGPCLPAHWAGVNLYAGGISCGFLLPQGGGHL